MASPGIDGARLSVGERGALGTLALSAVRPLTAGPSLRARTWHQGLERLGLVVPFSVVHDLGLVLTSSLDRLLVAPRCAPALLGVAGVADLSRGYLALLEELAATEGVRQAAGAGLRDGLVTMVLARLLGPVARRVEAERPYEPALPLDASAYGASEDTYVTLFGSMPRRFELEWVAALTASRLTLLTLADALEVDTLRLLGVLGDGAGAPPIAVLTALDDPSARDIARFSLGLLPSVLESKARPGASTHPAFGYAGVGRHGSIDGLVPSELAWDDEELWRRFADDELLYYSRDEERTPERRVHHLVIDASASMRGDRATFARGLALATAKKLLREGDDVKMRFFDARLYDVLTAPPRELPTAAVLAFRGERGRNPGRALSSLASYLSTSRQRDGREAVVHLFTHGAQDVPRRALTALSAEARIVAVLVAPRGDVDVSWLDLVDAHWVVTREMLSEEGARDDAAKTILTSAKSGAGRAS
jgi:hypothetical protein